MGELAIFMPTEDDNHDGPRTNARVHTNRTGHMLKAGFAACAAGDVLRLDIT
jgi:hypothetical protein